MKHPYFLLFAAFALFTQAPQLHAGPSDHRPPAIFVVSTTGDSGAGSLRAAIEAANKTPGTRITFRLGALNSIITPLAPLPPLLKPNTHIEGNNQITIVGDKVGPNGSGLRVQASRCELQGLKWRNWRGEAISIRSNRTVVKANAFEDGVVGIAVEGAKSKGNRFENNAFSSIKTPINLRNSSNGGIQPPILTIKRDDVISPISHKFTLLFKGKPNSDITFELNYSHNEAYQGAHIEQVAEKKTLKTDANGNAVWQFDRKGYPVGSWVALATQNGNTSAYSNTVVLPYLR